MKVLAVLLTTTDGSLRGCCLAPCSLGGGSRGDRARGSHCRGFVWGRRGRRTALEGLLVVLGTRLPATDRETSTPAQT